MYGEFHILDSLMTENDSFKHDTELTKAGSRFTCSGGWECFFTRGCSSRRDPQIEHHCG